MVNFDEVGNVQLAKFSLLTSTLVPGMFSDLLRSVKMLKTQWGAESNGKLLHLFIAGKTATFVPVFVMEDLPSAELQSMFLRIQWRQR